VNTISKNPNLMINGQPVPVGEIQDIKLKPQQVGGVASSGAGSGAGGAGTIPTGTGAGVLDAGSQNLMNGLASADYGKCTPDTILDVVNTPEHMIMAYQDGQRCMTYDFRDVGSGAHFEACKFSSLCEADPFPQQLFFLNLTKGDLKDNLNSSEFYIKLTSDNNLCVIVKDSKYDTDNSVFLGTCGGDNTLWRGFVANSMLFVSPKTKFQVRCLGMVNNWGIELRNCDTNDLTQSFNYSGDEQ
jgi:hypothetical protein